MFRLLNSKILKHPMISDGKDAAAHAFRQLPDFYGKMHGENFLKAIKNRPMDHPIINDPIIHGVVFGNELNEVYPETYAAEMEKTVNSYIPKDHITLTQHMTDHINTISPDPSLVDLTAYHNIDKRSLLPIATEKIEVPRAEKLTTLTSDISLHLTKNTGDPTVTFSVIEQIPEIRTHAHLIYIKSFHICEYVGILIIRIH